MTMLFNRKCAKFVPGKKTAGGDRPAVKRHQRLITWERLPSATTPLILPEDLLTHKIAVTIHFGLGFLMADLLLSVPPDLE